MDSFVGIKESIFLMNFVALLGSHFFRMDSAFYPFELQSVVLYKKFQFKNELTLRFDSEPALFSFFTEKIFLPEMSGFL
ncbi:hypothetical protein A0128_01765 [Leptospira tipperaryensis]|uniref:Uncharacterized protein n=1 Tax=Leptospira tipperaryensis TaxID=2564040 RepID=A0A1D7USV7_9LEPT|nr:hypothetical protein A0128_01765 [Leptospira tipperaryensis]